MSRLLVRYLPAPKTRSVPEMRIPSDRGYDLPQGFVSDKILEQGLIERADPERAKFRTFLLNAPRNFVISTIRYERAGERSPERLLSLGDNRGR